MAKIHPAVAQHAMEENEKLRGLLTTLRVSLNLDDTEYGLSQQEKRKLAADIDATLSQQTEPTDAFTAVDMATAAAQGFRDGQAAVGQAPAQDEREARRSVEPIVRALNASVAVGSDGDWVSIRREHRDAAVRMLSDLDADFRHVYQAYAEAQKRANRPAQTEQQPVAWQCRCVCEECVDAEWSQCSFEQYQMALADPDMQARALYAAPIAQTAPQPEQSGLVAALEYYANGDHLLLADPDEWDTCSSEPANFLHDEAGTASVEDGSIAKVALEAYRAAMAAKEA